MLGQVLFFIAGCFITALILFPLLRSHKTRIQKLETSVLDTEKDYTSFKDKTKKLTVAVRESASSVYLSTENRIGSGGHEDGMDKIEKTIGENTKITAEVVDKINSVAAIASKMEKDVLKGFTVLGKNVKKMGDIKEKNSGVINGIISLSNKVSKIRDIVRIINTVTDQTKVIAFNASLEAASAGETGKCFAVVAGEVNRLADDIDNMTRQIREHVEEILSSSNSLIVYSEEGADRIAEGYKLIKDLEDVFKEIRDGAEITSNQAQTITVFTKQELKSSEMLNNAIAGVSQEVKYCFDSAKTAALSVKTLTERTLELERHLMQEIFPGQD
jgi:methyl-accepting chemotaxis protein